MIAKRFTRPSAAPRHGVRSARQCAMGRSAAATLARDAGDPRGHGSFFALVLCGYLAARRGVLPEAAIPGLNVFVLFFALPCLLLRFGSSMPFSRLIATRCWSWAWACWHGAPACRCRPSG
jgi:hypothetical protein